MKNGETKIGEITFCESSTKGKGKICLKLKNGDIYETSEIDFDKSNEEIMDTLREELMKMIQSSEDEKG